MFKVSNTNTGATSMNDVVLVFSLLAYFTSFSSVSVVDFEQVNVSRIMFAKFSFMLLILENHRPGIAFWLLLTENLSLEKLLRIVFDYIFLPIACIILLGEDKCTTS